MTDVNVTLSEFLAGEALHYRQHMPRVRGGRRPAPKLIVATYRVGDGIYLEDEHGAALGKADVTDDAGARRAYHNLTRSAR